MDKQQSNTGIPLSAFISYAHEDEPLRQQLEVHLSLLRRQGLLTSWHDRQILAGNEWERDIDEHLESAAIILLLISPDFLASDYCYGVEMQRALERHKNGEGVVIPIIIRPVDWEGAPFVHLQCLPRDARAVTEWDNQDAAFRDIAKGIRAAISQLPATSTEPQPVRVAAITPTAASTRTPTAPTDRNRQRMLKRVHTTWIAGVLTQSLHGAALMVLGLEEKADVLDNPWRLLMQEVDQPTQLLPGGTRITEVYKATEGGLLILGQPGAGKTTLLLELARDLLDHAQASENAPIPVVFNLSSWAKKRLTLSDWLVEELSMRYEVPLHLGRSWVKEDQLLLLLDGLDEVESTARRECIEAINTFRQTHSDVQVVVCSRITEYLNEPTQLRLHTALVVQPLTQEQIDGYLESAGEYAKALREALHQDADLRELATTPLMLTILLFAYRGTSPDKISEQTSLEAKREQIFASYVQHMLKRRGASKRYQPQQITHWLAYLAQQMKRQNQTLFYIEQMQPDWLPKQWQNYVYRALAGGGVGGLLGGLIGIEFIPVFVSIAPTLGIFIRNGAVIYLLIGQILGSLIGLLHFKSTEIRTAEVLTWSWRNILWAFTISMVSGSFGFLIAIYLSRHTNLSSLSLLFYLLITVQLGGTLSALATWFPHRNTPQHAHILFNQRIWSAIGRGVLVGFITAALDLAIYELFLRLFFSLVSANYDEIFYYIYSVIIACASGFIVGLIFSISTRELETRNSLKPNQGIWRSLYNGGRVLLIVALIVWFFSMVSTILEYRIVSIPTSPQDIISIFLSVILPDAIAGLLIGLFFGLLYGGIACFKHMLLRVFLWRAKALPWHYTRFLDYTTERILLRKVGGGYIFVHRLLLEYFASLVTPVPKETPPVAVIHTASPVVSNTSQIETVPQEEKVSLLIPRRKTGFSKEKRIVALLIVVLLLEVSCGLSIFNVVQRSMQKAYDATASAQYAADNATATAQIVAYDATASAQVPVNATAEALANVSPVAYPPKNTPPVLDDPIQDNSKGNSWEVDDPSRGNCKFIQQVYDINTHSFERCFARATDFTNFVYEVQMKIVKGDGGGIAFRCDPTEQLYYYFAITPNGSYSVYDNYSYNNNYPPLAQGSSSAIHQGLNQTNLLAAVVHGSIIELYVNHHRVAVVGSSAYSHGRIGMIVTGTNNQTEVIFQNAKVWKL